MERVYAKVTRNGKEKYYIGRVLGKRDFTRYNEHVFASFMPESHQKWVETQYLVELSDRTLIRVWESDTFKLVQGRR